MAKFIALAFLSLVCLQACTYAAPATSESTVPQGVIVQVLNASNESGNATLTPDLQTVVTLDVAVGSKDHGAYIDFTVPTMGIGSVEPGVIQTVLLVDGETFDRDSAIQAFDLHGIATLSMNDVITLSTGHHVLSIAVDGHVSCRDDNPCSVLIPVNSAHLTVMRF